MIENSMSLNDPLVTGYRNKADKPKPERTLISPPNFRL
jgi:hypothetical protein